MNGFRLFASKQSLHLIVLFHLLVIKSVTKRSLAPTGVVQAGNIIPPGCDRVQTMLFLSFVSPKERNKEKETTLRLRSG